MFLVTILPDPSEQIVKGLTQLGGIVGQFFPNSIARQRAMQQTLIDNPELINTLADLEVETPGSIKSFGFGGDVGKQISTLAQSPERKQKRSLEQRELVVRGQQIGAIETILKNAPKELITNLGLAGLDLPSLSEEKLTNAQITKAMSEAALAETIASSIGEAEGIDIGTAALSILEGTSTPEQAAALVHPILGPAITARMQAVGDEQDRQLDRELTTLRASLSAEEQKGLIGGKPPAALLTSRREISTILPTFDRWKVVASDFMQLSYPERQAALRGIGNPENTQLARRLKSLEGSLRGLLRIAITGPGILSEADKGQISQAVGQPGTLNPFIDAEDVAATINEAETTMRSRLQGYNTELKDFYGVDVSTLPSAAINQQTTGMTKGDWEQAVRNLRDQGITDLTEIKRRVGEMPR